jgi:hypothetical protein
MISAKIQTVLAASLIAGLAAGGAMAFWGPPESGRGLPSPIAGPAKSSGEASEKPPTGGQVALRKIAIDADDIREAAGLNIFKFELDMPKDRRFHLVLRERKESSPWRELYRFPFVKSEEGRTTFRVSFMRRDGRFEGVLLSDAPDAEFRVASPGCSPAGIATIVQNPLRELPTSRRSYRFHFSNSKEDQSVDGDAPEPRVRRLLTMLESSNNPDAPPRPKDAPTRGELVLIEEE